ncbi:hypothetical protein [Streptomyces sp. NBC_01244]|nr:hypothetical protein OG247_40740 [Streptomyces sp. NBC_01244]
MPEGLGAILPRDDHRPGQRTLSLSSLLTLNPVHTDFTGLRAAVLR